MAIPASHVAIFPRLRVLAKGVAASTIPCVPPFREMIPTMPPRSSEKTTIWGCPPSRSPNVGTTNWSMTRHRPESGFHPAMAQAPIHTPTKRAATASRNSSARTMATSGGTRENHAGVSTGSTSSSACPTDTVSGRSAADPTTRSSMTVSPSTVPAEMRVPVRVRISYGDAPALETVTEKGTPPRTTPGASVTS